MLRCCEDQSALALVEVLLPLTPREVLTWTRVTHPELLLGTIWKLWDSVSLYHLLSLLSGGSPFKWLFRQLKVVLSQWLSFASRCWWSQVRLDSAYLIGERHWEVLWHEALTILLCTSWHNTGQHLIQGNLWQSLGTEAYTTILVLLQMMLNGALQVDLFIVGPEYDLKEKYAELSLVEWTGFLYVDKWYGQVRSFVRRWLVLGVV